MFKMYVQCMCSNDSSPVEEVVEVTDYGLSGIVRFKLKR